MNQVRMSVIMAIYNEPEEYLKQSIESILKQSFKSFKFVIVLDNPHNREAERLVKLYQRKDKRIFFIKNRKNMGLAASLNKGVLVAEGKYVARMDADDVSLPDRLDKQIKYLEKNKEVDLLFSWAYFIDESGELIKKFTPNRDKVKRLQKTFFKDFLFVHPTLLIKKEILMENPYDENNRGAEDFELWMRLISKGYHFDILEKFLLKYRIPKEDYEQRIKKQLNYSKYSLKALWKNRASYWKNIYYWKLLIHNLSLFLFINIMPDTFLERIIYLKDK